MKQKKGQARRTDKDSNSYVNAVEQGKVDVSISELGNFARALNVNPGVLAADMPKGTPGERLVFLNDVIKYLSGRGKPLHYAEVQRLVNDALNSRRQVAAG